VSTLCRAHARKKPVKERRPSAKDKSIDKHMIDVKMKVQRAAGAVRYMHVLCLFAAPTPPRGRHGTERTMYQESSPITRRFRQMPSDYFSVPRKRRLQCRGERRGTAKRCHAAQARFAQSVIRRYGSLPRAQHAYRNADMR
jgi:hypothetical protein